MTQANGNGLTRATFLRSLKLSNLLSFGSDAGAVELRPP